MPSESDTRAIDVDGRAVVGSNRWAVGWRSARAVRYHAVPREGTAMLVSIPPRSDDDRDLVRLGEANPGFRIEREPDGTITLTPTGGFGGARSGKAFRQLDEYADRAGGKAFDSNQGWKIGPDQTMRSPDASWIDQAKVDATSPEERRSSAFLAIVPDVAIEVKSESDDWRTALRKLADYRTRGTSYAVAIDPQTRDVVELGEPPPGLRLDFDAIIDA